MFICMVNLEWNISIVQVILMFLKKEIINQNILDTVFLILILKNFLVLNINSIHNTKLINKKEEFQLKKLFFNGINLFQT